MSQHSGEADAIDRENGADVANETLGTTEPRLRPVTSSQLSTLRKDTPSVNPEGATADIPASNELPQGFVLEEGSIEELLPRLTRLERRLRIQTFALVLALLTAGGLTLMHFVDEDVIVRQTLMESKEITLRDNDGAARLFIRMYSKVPVLQIMDSNGKPRMSLGLRFDDTPFLDLSDKRGRTRATFEMTENDSPALRLFDENGTPTFNIN